MLVTFFLWVKKFCLKRKTNHDISSLFIKLVDSGKDYLVPVSGKVPDMLKKPTPRTHTYQWHASGIIGLLKAGILFFIFWWKTRVCEVKNTTSWSSTKINFLYAFGNAKENNVDRQNKIAQCCLALTTRRNKYHVVTILWLSLKFSSPTLLDNVTYSYYVMLVAQYWYSSVLEMVFDSEKL